MAPKCSVESCICFEDLLKAVSFSEVPALLADIRPRLPIIHYVVPACSHWWFEITMSSIADLFIHFQLDDLRLAPNYPNPPALSVALRCGLHSAHAPAWSSNWISRYIRYFRSQGWQKVGFMPSTMTCSCPAAFCCLFLPARSMFELEAMYNWEISQKSAEVDTAGKQSMKEGRWTELGEIEKLDHQNLNYWEFTTNLWLTSKAHWQSVWHTGCHLRKVGPEEL